MKPIDVLQWVTDRDGSGGSPTRPMPAGRLVGNPACVWGDPGCEARGNEEAGRPLSPEICIVVDTWITPMLLAKGESRRFVCSGRQQSSFARCGATRTPPGSKNSACLYKEDLGTREIQRSPQRSRHHGSRVINVPALAVGKSSAQPRASKERRRGTGRRSGESPRDGVLEVLADHSTDGRTPGHSPGRSGRRGSNAQATRCREGEAGRNALTEGKRGET
jgi:hypothetical protein